VEVFRSRHRVIRGRGSLLGSGGWAAAVCHGVPPPAREIATGACRTRGVGFGRPVGTATVNLPECATVCQQRPAQRCRGGVNSAQGASGDSESCGGRRAGSRRPGGTSSWRSGHSRGPERACGTAEEREFWRKRPPTPTAASRGSRRQALTAVAGYLVAQHKAPRVQQVRTRFLEYRAREFLGSRRNLL
jgi:hypothetical protein